MSSAAMVALKAAVTQTVVSNPSQASTIAGYATATIVANIQSRNSSDQAPLANIVMQGVVDGIIRSPSLSNPMESGAVIAQAISSAASYASEPSLVTSMLSHTAGYLNGAATPANSANLSSMLQNAQVRLVSDFPNQTTAITAISTTVQRNQITAQMPGNSSNEVTSPTDSTSNPLQSSTTDLAATPSDRINRADPNTIKEVIAALIKEGVIPESIALAVAQTTIGYPTDVIAAALAAAGVPPERVVSALVAAAPSDQKSIVQAAATLGITPTAAGPAPAAAPATAATPTPTPAPAPATATFTAPSSGGGGGGTSTASTS